MMTENGIVDKANMSVAWVKTTRADACKHCASKESCGSGSQKEMIIKVKNTLNVDKGDYVVIGLDTRPMLFLTFLLYVFPIILLTIGAMIGNSIAPYLNLNPSFFAMITGFFFFGISFLIIRRKNTALAKNESYKPFLVRKKSQVIPTSCSIP